MFYKTVNETLGLNKSSQILSASLHLSQMSQVNAGHDDVDLHDPSLKDGGEVIFNNEIPLQIQGEQDSGEQIVRFKIITIGEEDELNEVRVEISCDADLFMFFEAQYPRAEFDNLKKSQNLTIEFEEFAGMLIESLTQNVKNPEEYEVQFRETSETEGILEFKQKLKFKSVDIFSLKFTASSNEFVKEQIQYRFNSVRTDLKMARTELSDVYSMLKIKNPSVLKQVRTVRK